MPRSMPFRKLALSAPLRAAGSHFTDLPQITAAFLAYCFDAAPLDQCETFRFRRLTSVYDPSQVPNRSQVSAWTTSYPSVASTLQFWSSGSTNGSVHGGERGGVCDADGAAGETRASVAGDLRVRVVAPAEVVDARVEHDSTTKDRAGSAEVELPVVDVELHSAVPVGDYVAQVAGMTDLVVGPSMSLISEVEVSPGCKAAFSRDVAINVYMKAVGRIGLQTRNLFVSKMRLRQDIVCVDGTVVPRPAPPETLATSAWDCLHRSPSSSRGRSDDTHGARDVDAPLGLGEDDLSSGVGIAPEYGDSRDTAGTERGSDHVEMSDRK